jgi:hypothetical protein
MELVRDHAVFLGAIVAIGLVVWWLWSRGYLFK